jgi:hypothetical protein
MELCPFKMDHLESALLAAPKADLVDMILEMEDDDEEYEDDATVLVFHTMTEAAEAVDNFLDTFTKDQHELDPEAQYMKTIARFEQGVGLMGCIWKDKVLLAQATAIIDLTNSFFMVIMLIMDGEGVMVPASMVH